ncbi:MAG TPA: hypothetical protein DIT89_04950 [Planctomycetaceae bacterium]|nr:hypothetical protein [Planctomycetaceae bacterium]
MAQRLRRKIVLLTVLLLVTLHTEWLPARLWRPLEGPSFEGDFVAVKGDDVQIRLADNTQKTVKYQLLHRADRAFVRSVLNSSGQQDTATRLANLERGAGRIGEPAADPAGTTPQPASPAATTPTVGVATALAPTGQPTATQPKSSSAGAARPTRRIWTDLQGQQLEAEFVGMTTSGVLLRVDGRDREFPFIGFCSADQEWLKQQDSEFIPGGQSFSGKVPAAGPPRQNPNGTPSGFASDGLPVLAAPAARMQNGDPVVEPSPAARPPEPPQAPSQAPSQPPPQPAANQDPGNFFPQQLSQQNLRFHGDSEPYSESETGSTEDEDPNKVVNPQQPLAAEPQIAGGLQIPAGLKKWLWIAAGFAVLGAFLWLMMRFIAAD